MRTILREGWTWILGFGVVLSALYGAAVLLLYRHHARRYTMRRLSIVWTVLGCLLIGLWLWWLTSWPVFGVYMLGMALFGWPHIVREVGEWLAVYVSVTENATEEVRKAVRDWTPQN